MWKQRAVEMDSEKIMISTDDIGGQKFADASSRATLRHKRDYSGMAAKHTNVERKSKETISRALLSKFTLANRMPARHQQQNAFSKDGYGNESEADPTYYTPQQSMSACVDPRMLD